VRANRLAVSVLTLHRVPLSFPPTGGFFLVVAAEASATELKKAP
jgi:hypothetical protein